jgi:hypothetical protein
LPLDAFYLLDEETRDANYAPPRQITLRLGEELVKKVGEEWKPRFERWVQ